MAILKKESGLIQLHKCPKCNYLVQWTDTVNEENLCKWCAEEQSVQLTEKWCPNCNLPPDEFGDCIRCGEPIAPATNA